MLSEACSSFALNLANENCHRRHHLNVTRRNNPHYRDVIMSAMGSQIIGVSIVCLTVCSIVDQRKHQSYASLAFVWGESGDRWIPPTKSLWNGKCLHFITSSWYWSHRNYENNNNYGSPQNFPKQVHPEYVCPRGIYDSLLYSYFNYRLYII